MERARLNPILTVLFPTGSFVLLAAMGLQLGLTPRALGVVGIVLGSLAWAMLSLSALLLTIPHVVPEQSAATREWRLGWYAAAMRLLLLLILIPVSFATVCQQLFVVVGGFTDAGVRSSDAIVMLAVPPSSWVEFAFSWLVDSVTFSASQVFGWTTTSIRSATWWSGALVVLYSVVAQGVVLAALLNVLRLGLGVLWRPKPASASHRRSHRL